MSIFTILQLWASSPSGPDIRRLEEQSKELRRADIRTPLERTSAGVTKIMTYYIGRQLRLESEIAQRQKELAEVNICIEAMEAADAIIEKGTPKDDPGEA